MNVGLIGLGNIGKPMAMSVPIETLSQVIAASSASRPKIESFGAVFDGDFEPKDTGFLRTDAKDVRPVTELAPELDVPAEIAALVDQRYVAALATGPGHIGGAAVVRVQEARSGVELRHTEETDTMA
jgi:3-hydroxyisobutyrate dehydrogenase-like beta-hydroxyacid dehydrogenase